MPKKPRRIPSYLLHKPTGQARVRIKGRDYYLGVYGSPESRERHAALVDQWRKDSDNASEVRLRIDDLVLLYLRHAAVYYRKHGKPTSEVNNIQIALRPLVRLCGRSLVSQFTAKDLKRVRQAMIDAGCVRSSINKQVARIARMFRWGVAEADVPATVVVHSESVKPLAADRSEAAESNPVTPVSDAAVDAIKPFVSRQVWAMIELQRATGMRPGEVLLMRGCDLTMGGKVWEYRPSRHKGEHHKQARIVYLGPQAQDIVREFLRPNLSEFLFSPADARAEFDAARKANRKTPMTPSQAARVAKRKPEKSAGRRYTVCSYGQAVRKACERAFEMPDELRNVSTKLPQIERTVLQGRAREWRAQHCWHPHQLRHTAATRIRREAGLDAARVVLGHKSLAMADHYAAEDFDKARAAAERLG